MMQGQRSTSGDGLCDIPIQGQNTTINSVIPTTPTSQEPTMNVILRKDKTAKDLAVYLHAICFAPVMHTFIKGIKNNHFLWWPGCSKKLIKKHLSLMPATVKGHLH